MGNILGSWRSRRWLLVAAIAIVAGGLLFWATRSDQGSGAANDAEPAAPVRVEAARREPLDVQIKALGTITPLATVSVRSRVEGELTRILFTEGQHVAKGQLLAQIDPRPFRANLSQAQGERRQNEAQLAQARRELEQHNQLALKGFTSRTKIDQQKALVGQFSGAIETNDGRIADARLQLEFASIRAPITGRIGLRGVDVGNLVRAGDGTEIATITQMQPISAIFTVPETQIEEVRQAMRQGRLEVEAWDRGERTLLATGHLATADNRIDAGSGTLRLRGTFANGDERLFPNQFVNIRLRVRTIPDAVTIPQSAVQRGASGPFLYVVERQGLARRRTIVAGPGDGERVQILRGVAPGEQVVLEGLDRVKNGGKVEIISPAATPRK